MGEPVIIYCGWFRETAVFRAIEHLGCGAGLTRCLECDGTGVFRGHPEIDELPCVACKATGKMYVSV